MNTTCTSLDSFPTFISLHEISLNIWQIFALFRDTLRFGTTLGIFH